MLDRDNSPRLEPTLHKEVEVSTESFVPVSDVSGKIEVIFANVRNTDSPILYAELDAISIIAGNTPDAKIVVGIDGKTDVWDVFFKKYPSQEAKVLQLLAERNISNAVTYTRTPGERGIWARDMGVWADSGKTFVLPGIPSSRGPYSSGQIKPTEAMVGNLKKVLGVEKVLVTDLSFEGGDYIPLVTNSFLGYSPVEKNGNLPHLLKLRTGKPAIPLGNHDVSSPFPHLDSATTFVTDIDVLINDPQAMFDLLRSLNKNDWIAWQTRIHDWYQGKTTGWSTGIGRTEEQIQLDTLADLQNIDHYGMFGYDLMRRSLTRGLEQMKVIGKQLEAAGVNSIGIPGIDVGLPLSTVNSLPDTDNGKRRLFLMETGCEKIDTDIMKRIQASGKVDQIISTGLGWPLFTARGGNRCVINALRK